MNIFIQLTSAGANVGPFDLYSDVDLITPFATGVARATLITGATYTVDNGTTSVLLQSTGACVNNITVNVVAPTTTSTSTTAAPTTSTTTTAPAIPISFDALYEEVGNPVCLGTAATIYTSVLTPDVGDVFYTNAGLTITWNLGPVVYIEDLGKSYFVNVANGIIISSGDYSCTTTTTTTVVPITIDVTNSSMDIVITAITVDATPITVISGSLPLSPGNSITATISDSLIGLAVPIAIEYTSTLSGQHISVDSASPLCYLSDAGTPATFTRDIVASDTITIEAADGACP